MKKVEEWRELSREILFEKYGRGITVINYRLPDGREEDFYIKHEKSHVRIIAVTKDKKIIAVRKFEPGIGKVLVAPPAGYIIEGELPQDTAERELLAETGYKGELKFLAETHGGYTDLSAFVAVVTECEKVLESPPEAKSEFLEVILLEIPEIRRLIRFGSNFTSDPEAWYLGLDHLELL